MGKKMGSFSQWVIGLLVGALLVVVGFIYTDIRRDIADLRQEMREMPTKMSEDATLRISAAISERLEPLAAGVARLEGLITGLHGETLVTAVDYPVTLAAIATKPNDPDDPAVILNFVDARESHVHAIRVTGLEDTEAIYEKIVEEVRLRSFQQGAIPVVLSRFTSGEPTIEVPQYVETTASFILVGDYVPQYSQDVVATILKEFGAEHVELQPEESIYREIRTLGDLIQVLEDRRGLFQRLPPVT